MRTSIAVGLLPFLVSAAPQAPRPATAAPQQVPKQQQREIPPAPKRYQANPKRADAVREAFREAWRGYLTVFPADEIKPISKQAGNSRNGWGATPVDALSTAAIMGEKAILNQILDFVPTINFSEQVNRMDSVSVFETTIRYLGGLISAHDLLEPSGPLANLVDPGKNIKALLDQAQSIANYISFSFTESPTGIPHNELYFPQRGDTERIYNYDSGVTDNGLATLGTLVLEWVRLADKTGNKTYAQLAERAESYLLDPKPASQEPFPGLISSSIDIATGNLQGNYVSWSGGADSFYEYLIKMWVYDPKRYSKYRDRWVTAIDSSIKYLAYTAQPAGSTFLREYNGRDYVFKSGHLTCFNGGNFILGGIVLDRKDYIDFGIKLVEGCQRTYNSTAIGLGPERFSFDPNTVPENQRELWNKGGFYISANDPEWASGYYLRPEVIESIYYAWRATGDPIYQEWAWKAFEAIQAKCKTELGYVGHVNVNNATTPFRIDMQESFFFAETLKYAYLIQAGESEWQVGGPGSSAKTQKWVYNTEAHPVRVFSGSK